MIGIEVKGETMRTFQWISCIVALIIFGAIAVLYDHTSMQTLDAWAADLLYENTFIIAFHYLGETAVVLLIGLVLIVYFAAIRKSSRHAFFVFLTIIVGYGINQGMKRVFERPRPELVDQLTSYSFPSGHTMASLLWILTIVFLVTSGRQLGSKAVAMWGVGVIIFTLVGLSRVAQNRHYFTDVIGGWALAYAWLMLCILWFTKSKSSEKGRNLH